MSFLDKTGLSRLWANILLLADTKVPLTRKINGKSLSTDISLSASDVGADASGAANTALSSAKTYTDQQVANKADKSHTHTIANVTNLQTELDTLENSISTHTHTISNVTNLQATLDSKVSSSALDNYYTTAQIDNMEFITTSDIDNICNS